MKEIIVYADWKSLGGPSKMGILRVENVRGEEVFSFVYDDQWLQSGKAQILDPDLKHYTGPQYITDEKPNFGLFTDSSPDRWGKTLMQRREAILARTETRERRQLFESDYLLGIQDETRMGALRFKVHESGKFLNDSQDLTTPPITSIRELEQASLKFESEGFFEDIEAAKWLKMLFAPGSSLGGARPKASVIDPDGQLWIAKFPSKNDALNSGAWEYIVNQLGNDLGLSMSQAIANTYSQRHHTFLTKRFDREKTKTRIHFGSAMTLLGYKDGADCKEGRSYLELIELIEMYGADPTADIQELWKRMAFSVAVSNTDDHLRNHGFLLTPKGWKLSPAYDVNPNPVGYGLNLNIDEDDNSLDFELVKSVAKYFRMGQNQAEAFLNQMNEVIDTWHQKATAFGLSSTEIEMMAPAFRT